MERNLRYVELNENGIPFHENWKMWFDGPSEDEMWSEMTAMAADRGHTLLRIATDDPKRDRNPRLVEIEGDGNGGIRAKDAYPDAMRDVKIFVM